MKKIIILLLLSTILLAGASEDRCVNIGYGKEYKWDKEDKKYIENTCDREVYIFWCHYKDEKGYSDGVCGKKPKFYAKATIFKPKEKRFNIYTIPTDSDIRYGECPTSPGFTWDNSVAAMNADGTYVCAMPGLNQKLEPYKIAIPCANKTKVFTYLGRIGPDANILKLQETETGIIITFSTKDMRQEDINDRMCKDSGEIKDPSLLNKLKRMIQTNKYFMDTNASHEKVGGTGILG